MDCGNIGSLNGQSRLQIAVSNQCSTDPLTKFPSRGLGESDRQYPLGPKVTALAFGRDRRLPVTNAFRE